MTTDYYTPWEDESDCRQWLLYQLECAAASAESRFDIRAFPELSLRDVFGKPARADIGLLCDGPEGDKVLLLVELKHEAGIPANLADGIAQVYQYVEFCTIDDPRLPSWRGRSATMGFAGVTGPRQEGAEWQQHASQGAKWRQNALQGVETLAFKLRVGSVRLEHNGTINFCTGTNNILRQQYEEGPFHWTGNARNFVSRRIKRKSGMDERKSIAETFAEAMGRLSVYEDLF